MKIWAKNLRYIKSVEAVNTLLSNEKRLLIPRLPDVGAHIKFDSIPEYSKIDLKQACVNRATELTKTITPMILWSGGVDSTLVLASFLSVSPADTITVGITQSTLDNTDPSFMTWLISIGVNIVRIDQQFLRKYTKDGGVFVTGTHGDNLFLSDAVGHGGGMNSKLATDIWSMATSDLMEVLTGRSNGKSIWDKYRWLYEAMPEHIPRDAPNCLWWTGYCFYWHRDSIYMTLQSDYGIPGITHNHFFNSNEIQKWMLNPVQFRAGRSVETHKNVAIDLIYDLIGFKFCLKQKTDGWEQVLGNKSFENVASIDENFKIRRFI